VGSREKYGGLELTDPEIAQRQGRSRSRDRKRPAQIVYVVFNSAGPLAAYGTLREAQSFVELEARTALSIARLGVSRLFTRRSRE